MARWLAVLLAALALGASAAAHAGTEEFSTFGVESQEEDDESMLDHLLTRPPHAWRDEWERAPQAIRTSQGCLTSGQWFIDTQLKLRTPLGRRASFGLDLDQDESDRVSFNYADFYFRFPTAWGTPGAMFRPLFDKSRQDFAVFWEAGDDTSAVYLQTRFTFEDTFNNLWAFRQTRVGQASEPYLRHPYEPMLRFTVRQPRWRTSLLGQYLTPSRKRVVAGPSTRIATLWGTLGAASIEADALGFEWELRGENKQAASTDQPSDLSSPDARDVRRQWWIETTLRRQITDRWATEAHWLYQERTETFGAPIGPRGFAGVDRVLQLETSFDVLPGWTASLGGLHDRITIARTGNYLYFGPFSWGTRVESRAYVGLAARFGRVSVHGVEGIELDPEQYEVWVVHDKAFLHLQTTF